MRRATSVVTALTVVLLATGIAVLQHTEGADPSVAATDDALPSRALGLSDHRRLARQRELPGGDDSADGPRSPRTAAGPLRPVTGPLRDARPLRLRVPGLGIDVRVTRAPGGYDGPGSPTGDQGAGPSAGQDGHAGRGGHPRPGRSGDVAWHSGGPAPGAAGTAVIGGPGLDLAGLRPGRTVEVTRDDGRTAVFTVIRVSPGPSGESDDGAGRPRLRLIGGESSVLAQLTGQRGSR